MAAQVSRLWAGPASHAVRSISAWLLPELAFGDLIQGMTENRRGQGWVRGLRCDLRGRRCVLRMASRIAWAQRGLCLEEFVACPGADRLGLRVPDSPCSACAVLLGLVLLGHWATD